MPNTNNVEQELPRGVTDESIIDGGKVYVTSLFGNHSPHTPHHEGEPPLFGIPNSLIRASHGGDLYLFRYDENGLLKAQPES